MALVSSRHLRKEIMKNFTDFLAQKLRESPERKDYADLLSRLKK